MTRSASLLVGGDETIVAIATAEGRGALATIRISGARAIDMARALGASDLAPRTATRVLLQHPVDHTPIDDALVTAFVGPNSYTGEDVVELSTHGGRIAPRLVLNACVAAGARLALPGEFTRRAVLNGRMDLLQAEAVAELIDARTSAMHRQALRQLDGALSTRFTALREQLLQLEALIAYDIDFPEEDDGPIDHRRIAAAIEATLGALDALLATVPTADILRDGALVVIAGPPNAGKSSLFNALLGEARALVTPIAGTTRDAIEAVLDTPAVPLRLVDTAGLRDTDDEIERMGIEVSARYLAAAHVAIACGETVQAIRLSEAAVRSRSAAPIVPVLTKSDLRSAAVDADDDRDDGVVAVSAATGDGLGALLDRITAVCAVDGASNPADDDVVVLRERQRLGLVTARDEVLAFRQAWDEQQLPAIVAAVHLQAATAALDAVIGAVSVDDILDRVFRDFCIGK